MMFTKSIKSHNNIIKSNVFHESRLGIKIEQGENTYILNNTCVRAPNGIRINQFQPSQASWLTEMQGNLIYDCGSEINIVDGGNGVGTINLTDTLIWDPDGPQAVDDPNGDIDTETNTIATDPNFNNPTGITPADFVPQVSSDAIDGTTEHVAFQDFEDLYGIDIRKDILGSTWLASDANINIGAIQAE